MKQKGFTLIELLGVIVILALLMIFVLPSIINYIKSANSDIESINLELIYNQTELYIEENINDYPKSNGNKYCISLTTLVEEGKLSSPITLSDNKEDITDLKTVQVSYNNEYKYELVDNNLCQETYISVPNLYNNTLTPVTYNGTNWVVASPNSNWYNYENQEWANAVILDSSVDKDIGDTLDLSKEVLAMFVWIPRYEYKIEGTYGKGGTSVSPGEIEINFISKNTTQASDEYRIHTAFTFGIDNEVSGIWVSKFEISSTSNDLSCVDENCESADNIRILPNVTAMTNKKISSLFYGIRSMSRDQNIFKINSNLTDSHMIKNSEWGAVAYLSQSKYGKYGNSIYSGTNKEIYQNKSTTYITGSSNGTPSTDTTNSQCTYDNMSTNCGIGASTTGNIYGIYDMSGGAWEYTMGVFANSDGYVWSGQADNLHSGFTGKLGTSGIDYNGLAFPNFKYYDLYKSTSGTTIDVKTSCNGGVCFGHALSETKGWYKDFSNFISSNNPWVIRGGMYNTGTSAGIFSYLAMPGSNNPTITTRVVLVSNS